MMKKNVLALGLLVLFSAFSASSTANEAAEPAPMSNKAEQTAKTVCAACHGADGNSAISVNPKLAGQHPAYLAKQLKDFKSGKRDNAVMAGMAAMVSDADIANIATYFAKQKPTLAKANENGKGSLGEKIYRAGIADRKVPACASCHGAAGAGLPAQFPRLAGQHADYTLAQLKIFSTSARANAPMMIDIASRMTEAQMAAVADYIQGLR